MRVANKREEEEEEHRQVEWQLYNHEVQRILAAEPGVETLNHLVFSQAGTSGLG
jgi:hypothetical protein